MCMWVSSRMHGVKSLLGWDFFQLKIGLDDCKNCDSDLTGLAYFAGPQWDSAMGTSQLSYTVTCSCISSIITSNIVSCNAMLLKILHFQS